MRIADDTFTIPAELWMSANDRPHWADKAGDRDPSGSMADRAQTRWERDR